MVVLHRFPISNFSEKGRLLLELKGVGHVIRDHRAIVGTAIGDLDRDEWIGLLRVSEELAPEYATEAFRFPAWSRRGRVWVARTAGRTREGGPFEYLFVGLFQTDGERLTHLELFDAGDLDRALARFEELSADDDAPRRA